MKTTDLMISMMLLVAAVPGCDDDGDTMDDGAGPGGTSSASGDGGGEESDDGSQCSMQSPEGDACEEGADCTVSCLCSGGSVDTGRCVNGSCGDPDEACADACEEFEKGAYDGAYCSVGSGGSGDSGGDGPSDDDGGGGACVPTGETCDINGDCCGFASESSLCTTFDASFRVCADVCFFDTDCLSGCCVPLQEGGNVCGPSDLCL